MQYLCEFIKCRATPGSFSRVFTASTCRAWEVCNGKQNHSSVIHR